MASCVCGREHNELTQVIAGEGALRRSLPNLAALGVEWSKILTVMDTNTEAALGTEAIKALESLGNTCIPVVIGTGDGGRLIEPDEKAVFQLVEAYNPEIDWIVSVGSGTITDICRFFTHRVGARHIALATAPSMDGYTSSVAPIITGGFKRTYPASPPRMLVADTDILAQAPREMVLAGYGDLIGKYTANADWVAAHIAFGEYRCPLCWEMLNASLEICNAEPEAIGQREPAVIEVLTQGLIDSGIAIMYAGSSRPASGAEHLLSHAWEMMALQEGSVPKFHGAQVGVAAVLVTRLYEKLLTVGVRDFERIDAGKGLKDIDWYIPRLRESFSSETVSQILRDTGDRDRSPGGRNARLRLLAANWEAVCEAVRNILLPAPRLTDLLSRSGAPATYLELGIPRDWVRRAFTVAHQLRNRYTALNLADDLGILDEFIEEL